MKNRQLFRILKKIWNQIYKQLTQFSLRFRHQNFNYMDAEYTSHPKVSETNDTKIPEFIQTDLVPERVSIEEVVEPEEVVTKEAMIEEVAANEVTIEDVVTDEVIVTEVTELKPIEENKPLIEEVSKPDVPKKEIKKGPLRLAVDKIPIIEVAKRYGWLTHPQREGANYLKCPLPSHRESKSNSKKKKGRGSFVINTYNNTARCWKCGSFTYTDAASLFAAVRGEQKQWMATLVLARDFQLITEDVFQRALKGERVMSSDIQESPLFVEFKPVDMHRNSLNYLNIDRMYRCLMLTYRVTATSNDAVQGFLSKEDFDYLHSTRKMSYDSIREGQYFTFPKPHHFKTFVEILLHNKIITSLNELDAFLKGVPGFYYDCQKQSWTFKRKNGIGIPIKNADGLIVGIQVRNSDHEMNRLAAKYPDEEPLRYSWFSSGWDIVNDRLHGSSPGAPIDVVKPKTLKSNVVFITEGHFKAQKIAETFNCLALSVQGVSTFNGIEIEIQKLMKQGYPITHIYLAYDADLSYKPNVFKSSQATMALLAKHFPQIALYYVGWDVQFGKGIDDLIEAGHRSRLSKLPRETFEKLCVAFHEVLDQSIMDDWTDEKLILFYNQNILSHFPGYDSYQISAVGQ